MADAKVHICLHEFKKLFPSLLVNNQTAVSSGFGADTAAGFLFTPILGAKPHEPLAILEHGEHGALAEALFQ